MNFSFILLYCEHKLIAAKFFQALSNGAIGLFLSVEISLNFTFHRSLK